MDTTTTEPRFRVDADLIAVYDTETDLYAGYLLLESVFIAVEMLNKGDFKPEDMAGGWDPRSYYED
jgi:hypothetical protein